MSDEYSLLSEKVCCTFATFSKEIQNEDLSVRCRRIVKTKIELPKENASQVAEKIMVF